MIKRRDRAARDVRARVPVILVVALLCFDVPAVGGQERLQGDPRAVEAVERLVERLGGSPVWVRARTLHLVYQGWLADPAEPMVEVAWKDLRTFDSRVEFMTRSFTRVRVITSGVTWEERNGDVVVAEEARHHAFLSFRAGDPYNMIRRFAAADQTLRLAFREPNRVLVESSSGDALGWWEIDSTGQPLRWGHSFDGVPLEYVYLPVRPFGVVNFPAGGAATDGSWRFTYELVELSDGPVPVSLEVPGG